MRKIQKLEDDYRELNLEPWAGLEEVKKAYRELAQYWHPDRFQERPAHQASAHQKMTRINLAYERIRKVLARNPARKPAPAASRPFRPPAHQETRATEAYTNGIGMKFVSVPGTQVLFSVWETRVRDYSAYVQASGGVDSAWSKPGFTQTPDHPVVNVSWEDARNFCAWLSSKERQEGRIPPLGEYRLPRDAEWSSAAGIGELEGGGTAQMKAFRLRDIYPWGTAWPPPVGAGNYDPSMRVDSFDYTSPVGSFAPNENGLYDLGGNVWEWCEDFLNGVSGARVLRGASWNFSGPAHLLSSYRNAVMPDARSTGIGFRCVLVR